MAEVNYTSRKESYGKPRDTLSMRPLATRKLALIMYKAWWKKEKGSDISDEAVLFENLEANSSKYREFLRTVEAMPTLRVAAELEDNKGHQAKKAR